ncbi:uncharacterized protein LOC143433115 [Xylocopa sonorina]|uniref:uncharacterized protein LOC143433115 n=1 Tax=Xylocopa sonorina TaxID=1818115 RepID=UPI00403AC60F
MANMRVLVLLYWIVFQLMLTATIVNAGDRHMDDHRISTNVEAIVTRKLPSSLLRPLRTTDKLIRNKRNEEIEDEAVPTRHSKHRKRSRSKNQAICLRSTFAAKLFFLGGNDTILHRIFKETENSDVNNPVLEVDEEPRDQSVINGPVQELYNGTRENDYNFTYIDDEKGRTDPKGRNLNVSLADLELVDSYEEQSISSEIEFESTDPFFTMSNRSKKDEPGDSMDYISQEPSSAMYSAVDDHVAVSDSLSALLSKLFQSLRNTSTTDSQNIFEDLNFVNETNLDPCQKWLNSKDKLEQVFLDGLVSLPACPCQYPSNIFYENKVWDERRQKYFRWRDVSGSSHRLDVYKPGANYCVRSLLTQGSGSAAAQHCCYDGQRKLLTRGSGAGTPNFVSPEISPILHKRIDVLPWRLCKGDFSRYNEVRPPNNDNDCETNPDDEEYQRQIDRTKYY